MASIKVTLELDDRGYIQKIQVAQAETKKLGAEAAAAGTKGAAGMTAFAAGVKVLDTAVKSAMASLAPLFALATAIQTITGTIAFADEIDDLAKSSEIGAAYLLQLRQAMMASGGDAEAAGNMVTKLINNLDSAAKGSKEAQDNFAKLGINLNDISKMSPEEALKKTISSLAEMKDPIQRNALAFDLLGKRAAGIDWQGVANGTATVSEENKRAAAQIERVAQLQDAMKIGYEQIKIAVLDLLTPFVGLIEEFKKFTTIGNILKALVLGIKIAFATLAVVINDVMTIIELAASGIGTLFDAIGLAAQGKFSEAGDALLNFGEKFKKSISDANAFADKAMKEALGQGPAPEPAAGGAAGGGRVGGGRGVTDAAKGQIDSLRGLADAFAESNARAREKLQTDYALIGASEEEKKVTEERIRIQNAAIDQVKRLEDQRSKLGNGATDARVRSEIDKTIEKIKAQAVVDQAATEASIRNGEQRVRSIQDIQAQLQITFGGDLERRQIQQSVQLANTQTEIERRLLEEKFKLNEIYLKEKADLEAKYAGAAGGIPQSELDQLEFRRRAREEQAKLTNAEIADNIKTQQQFTTGWQNAYNQWLRDSEDNSKAGAQTFNTFRTGFEQTLTDFVMTGKLSFKEFARSMLAEFVKIQAANVFKGLFSTGGPLAALGAIFNPTARAEGGPVMGGRPYLIGEKGPELMVPRTAGTVIPNNQLGLMGNNVTNVNYSIQAVDAMSFRQMLARDPEYLYGLTEQTRRSLPSRRRQ